MSKKVYKYELQVADSQQIEIPLESRILSVQCQGYDKICVWVLVDETYTDAMFTSFYVIGTGNTIPFPGVLLSDTRCFIGTVQTHGGAFVWHVFTDHPFQV